jgi:hypothetical protein
MCYEASALGGWNVPVPSVRGRYPGRLSVEEEEGKAMWVVARTIGLMLLITIVLNACGESDSPPPPAPTPPPASAPAPTPTSAPTTAPPPKAAAPTPPDPSAFRVVSIDLGKNIGADKKIAEPTTTFAPKDVIFVVVSTDGNGSSVQLQASSRYPNGSVGDVRTQPVESNGPGATVFHLRDVNGLPAGKYKVEISVNGASVGEKEFTVQ